MRYGGQVFAVTFTLYLVPCISPVSCPMSLISTSLILIPTPITITITITIIGIPLLSRMQITPTSGMV